MENHIFELQYAIDTFYFLICGALVMWMAAGFAMLESGLVRAKNTTEILTKNVALYAVSCIMYLICGYAIMYEGGFLLAGIDGGDTLVDDALKAKAQEYHEQLVELAVELDEDVLMEYLEGNMPDVPTLKRLIRKGTLDLQFVPVLTGTAFKNKGKPKKKGRQAVSVES